METRDIGRIGVDSFIWSENFGPSDLWIIEKAKELGFSTLDLAIAHPECFPVKEVKAEVEKVGIEVVTSTTLSADSNLISRDEGTRQRGVESLKALIDINNEIGSRILGGVNYAAWGYLSGKPRTEQEWEWSVCAMREVGKYAKDTGEMVICVEPVNRFESHFLNIAEDAVRYCREVGGDNIKVHLDTFHMIHEETSFREAVRTCGKQYLGYVHLCENNRGVPGTGLVPWQEFFIALHEIQYNGPMVIESFDPGFKELNRLCAIWRKFAESGQELALSGKSRLEKIIASVW
jgi:D-psicose/D-tagatose/L-ribulose 3-epimerase